MTKKYFIQGFLVSFVVNMIISYFYMKKNFDFSDDGFGDIMLLMSMSIVAIFSIVIAIIVGHFYSKYKHTN